MRRHRVVGSEGPARRATRWSRRRRKADSAGAVAAGARPARRGVVAPDRVVQDRPGPRPRLSARAAPWGAQAGSGTASRRVGTGAWMHASGRGAAARARFLPPVEAPSCLPSLRMGGAGRRRRNGRVQPIERAGRTVHPRRSRTMFRARRSNRRPPVPAPAGAPFASSGLESRGAVRIGVRVSFLTSVVLCSTVPARGRIGGRAADHSASQPPNESGSIFLSSSRSVLSTCRSESNEPTFRASCSQ